MKKISKLKYFIRIKKFETKNNYKKYKLKIIKNSTIYNIKIKN